MGEVYFAPDPRCPVHGQMTYVPAMSRWECRGYDGIDGCGHVVTDEECAWRHIGSTEACASILGENDL